MVTPSEKNKEFSFRGLLPEELGNLLEEFKEPRYRAIQIFEGLYKHRYTSWDEFTNLPASLRNLLKEKEELKTLPITAELVGWDGTRKFTFLIENSKEVEAVWIPKGDGERKTICISSQVGCTLNCTFCATAKLPFRGNLKTWQILEQVLAVERRVGDRATNIVFMGMGEPFHNYKEVLRAAKILHHNRAWNLGARRITISTAGVVPGIYKWIENKEPYKLAISLNHPDPMGRQELMDVTKKHSLEELLQACEEYVKKLDKTITFEYVMIPGVNMSEKEIQLLSKIAKRIGKCKFNVIPLNTEFYGWRRPSPNEVNEFIEALRAKSQVPVMNRNSPGKEISGACGMLALSKS